MRWEGTLAHEEVRSVLRILVGKPAKKRPIGRIRHIEDDLKTS
jgi:hypothetical protein